MPISGIIYLTLIAYLCRVIEISKKAMCSWEAQSPRRDGHTNSTVGMMDVQTSYTQGNEEPGRWMTNHLAGVECCFRGGNTRMSRKRGERHFIQKE